MKNSTRFKRQLPLWLIIFVFILLLASIPRSIELLNGNYLFGYDQGKQWLGAKALVVDHKIPLIGDEVGGARGFFQGPGWIYLLSVPFYIFKGDPYGAIVLMFIIGVGVVALSLWLFNRLFGILEASFIGFFLAISPALISSSRFTWPPFVIPLLTVIYLYYAYRIIEGKRMYLTLLFFIIGLMANFEIATAGTVFLTTIIIGFPYFLVNKVQWRILFLSICSFLIPLSPLIIFDFRHNFLNIRGIYETFFTHNRAPSVVPTMQHLFANHTAVFNAEYFNTFQLGIIPKWVILAILAIGLFVFVDKNIKKTEKIFLGFLYIYPVVLFCILMAYRNDLWGWWLLELHVIACILFGIICSRMIVIRRIIINMISVIILCLMTFQYGQSTLHFWRYDFPDYGGVAKIRGKIDAFDFIYNDAKSKDFGLFFFTPPVYTYAYDYINWWRGTSVYGYIAPQEKKHVFYLLAEPDPEKPWTYKGWLETAITGGTAVSRTTLPSGFIVEKRTMP